VRANLEPANRVTRGFLGVALLAVGLLVGRRAWWGVMLDVTGAVLLLSAKTGFCHVRKVCDDLGSAKET